MDQNEAFEVLGSLENYERGFAKYGAGNYQPDKVGRMLDELGEDISPLRFFHVAGTNGKGSVSLYIANLLSAQGFRTGLYTSPHVFTPLERIRIADGNIDPGVFSDLVARYIGFFRERSATYFEALTLIAVKAFLDAGCRYAVLETGLGGRLDSTNFCLPLAAAITPVGYDHTAILGDTLPEIAAEKAGIVKQDRPVAIGRQLPEAMDVLTAAAGARNAPVFRFDENVNYGIKSRGFEGSVFDADVRHPGGVLELRDVPFTRMGDVLVENFLHALLTLAAVGIVPDRDAVVKAASVHQPCRTEPYRGCILDVAHNPAALEALVSTLELYAPGRGKRLWFGILADKEIARVAEALRRHAGAFESVGVYDFDTFDGKRPSGGKALFEALSGLPNVRYYPDISEIRLDGGDLNVFAGSFYSLARVMALVDDRIPR